MRFATGILGGACLALALMAGATPSMADAVGLVQRLQNTVYGTPAQAAARVPKYRRDGIEYREVIETARNSAVDIGFVDGSNLTIGADATLMHRSIRLRPGELDRFRRADLDPRCLPLGHRRHAAAGGRCVSKRRPRPSRCAAPM